MDTVFTKPSMQVTGITLMAPPSTQYQEGIRATAIPTVPVPPTTATLTTDQWIMDPSGQIVLILDGAEGLVLYRVLSGNPTSGQFQGTAVWGPFGASGVYFCAQADGNAVVYDSSFPKSLNPTFHANNGTSGSAQYLFVQENGCFVTIECKGVWGSPL